MGVSESDPLIGRAAERRAVVKTHCKNGHLFDEENTYITPMQRGCRACDAERKRKKRAELHKDNVILYSRHRHEELDYLRIANSSFNLSWKLFFGTAAPGDNPRVAATKRNCATSPNRLSAFVQRRPLIRVV